MTTQARELAKLVTNAGDVNLGDDISLASDGAVLNFGADNDVTLTHVADTGLLLNSSRQLQFGDSGTFIRQEADGVLDLTSDTEIELNATTLDINANVDISGTLTVAGALDFGDLDISNVGSIALDTITNDGTDITLDSSGDIVLDADGADIRLKDGGTQFGVLYHSSGDFVIQSDISDKDIIFKGNDGGSAIEAMRIDMSAAGNVGIGTTTATNAKLEVVATSGEVFRADANNGAYRLVANQTGVIMNGTVGIGATSPSATFHINTSTNSPMLVESTHGDGGYIELQLSDISSTPGSLTGYIGDSEALVGSGAAGDLAIRAQADFVVSSGGSSERFKIASDGNVGVGNSNPQHPFVVHLTDGEIAMFGSNGMNSVGDYCGIGLGQVLANNTTYQKISIVAEGRDSGNYIQNLHFLVDTAADANSAVLTDSKMAITGAAGFVGMGSNLMNYQAGGTDLHPLYVQTGVTNGTVAASSGFIQVGAHDGGNANSDGYLCGIALGYHENNASYKHTAIGVRAMGDGAARRSMVFLVNTAAEAASAALGDAKLTIAGDTGVVSGDLNDTSDIGFKENIADLGNTLSIVNQLKPRTFKWKDRHASRGDSVGFIAQEIQSVVDNNTLVQGEAFDPEGIPGPGLSLNTIGIVAYLTKAIQELSTELDAAKARITTLEG